MRTQRLIPQMWNHIGDFASLLKESWGLAYEYSPCPPIVYPEIKGEIWCHRYYLKHLCNESKYPNWEIRDHVQFLQAVLSSWKIELAREGAGGMSLKTAAHILELDPSSLDDVSMKKAFRRYDENESIQYNISIKLIIFYSCHRLAKKYHPDRNPAGREKFEHVHEAYKRLQESGDDIGGPRQWCILLYIKAQCLLYKRNGADLAEFKYAGYPQLLSTMTLMGGQESSQILSEEHLPLLEAVLELCWLTCDVSELNAEELMRSGGADLLGGLLDRCVSAMPLSTPSGDSLARLTTNILNAFAAMVKLDSGRQEVLDHSRILVDALSCCKLQRAFNVVITSLKFLYSACQRSEIQDLLHNHWILGHVLPLLFLYDPSTKISSQQMPDQTLGFLGTSVTDYMSYQTLSNHVAINAVKLVSASLGAKINDKNYPQNRLAQESFKFLLSPSVARLLDPENPGIILEVLSKETQTPRVIWGTEMKVELFEFLEQVAVLPAHDAMLKSTQFKYRKLQGQLYISGVFVDQFLRNKSVKEIDEIKFCKGLVKAIHALSNLQESSLKDSVFQIRQGVNEFDTSDDTLGCLLDETFEAMRSRNMLLSLKALQVLLEMAPKLLGLLSTVASVEPLQSILIPICIMGDRGQVWPGDHLDTLWDEAARGKSDMIFQNPSEAILACQYSVSIFKSVTSNAKCLPAMAEPKKLLLLSWIIHRPPSLGILSRTCEIVHALANQDETALFAAEKAGIIYLLQGATHQFPDQDSIDKKDQLRYVRETLLQSVSNILRNTLHGRKSVLLLESLLPQGMVVRLMVRFWNKIFVVIHILMHSIIFGLRIYNL